MEINTYALMYSTHHWRSLFHLQLYHEERWVNQRLRAHTAFEENHVWFPAAISHGSELPVTPTLGDPLYAPHTTP